MPNAASLHRQFPFDRHRRYSSSIVELFPSASRCVSERVVLLGNGFTSGLARPRYSALAPLDRMHGHV